jgi:hypothetical protein
MWKLYTIARVAPARLDEDGSAAGVRPKMKIAGISLASVAAVSIPFHRTLDSPALDLAASRRSGTACTQRTADRGSHSRCGAPSADRLCWIEPLQFTDSPGGFPLARI